MKDKKTIIEWIEGVNGGEIKYTHFRFMLEGYSRSEANEAFEYFEKKGFTCSIDDWKSKDQILIIKS